MDLHVLWTDALFYLLVILIGFFIFRVIKDKNARANWVILLNQPKNLIASCVLVVFTLIALVDSIHWQTQFESQSVKVISLLDYALKDMAMNKETSYSAPFAIHAFSQESLVNNDGSVIRDFPRLQYAGKHLSDPSEHYQDIHNRLKFILLKCVLITVAASILLTFIGALKNKQPFETFGTRALCGTLPFPYRTAWCLLFVLVFVTISVIDLMPYYHILGTSKVGEDVFYQSVKSIRTGILIGTLTTLLMLPFALMFGLMAGYFRGWVDDVIQYTYTTLSAIPGVLLIAAMVLSMQVFMSQHEQWFATSIQRADIRLLGLCAILGLTSWTGLCRLIRAECLKLSQMDYVHAAKTLGTSQAAILVRHLLPNVSHIILISIALDFSGLVLAEAVLSYVGVGVDPSTYSWGTMINGARLEMAREPIVWWSLMGAFVMMFVLVLCANIFSDGVRDATDPRLSRVTA